MTQAVYTQVLFAISPQEVAFSLARNDHFKMSFRTQMTTDF